MHTNKRLFLLLSLLMVLPSAWAEEIIPSFIGGVKPDAVWTNPNFSKIAMDCNQKYLNPTTTAADTEAQFKAKEKQAQNCLADAMIKGGASKQAIAFLRYNSPIPSAIKEIKNYKYASVVNANVLMADAASGFFIIGKSGQIIRTYDPVNVTKSEKYQNFMKKFPKAMLWTGPDQVDWPKVSSAADDEQYIFHFPFLNGCHACGVLGYADVSFNFNNKGLLTEIKLLDTSEADQAKS